jgi:septal ring factor EnvC (AmiA/AmiB activator)
MKSLEELRSEKDTVRKDTKIALKEIKRAEREIGELQRELKAGTIDRKKLESGLEKVHKDVRKIAHHIAHFKG